MKENNKGIRFGEDLIPQGMKWEKHKNPSKEFRNSKFINRRVSGVIVILIWVYV